VTVPLRQFAARVVDNLLDIRGDAAEIPILGRRVNIHNAADVVMRGDGVERLRRKGGQAAEQLG